VSPAPESPQGSPDRHGRPIHAGLGPHAIGDAGEHVIQLAFSCPEQNGTSAVHGQDHADAEQPVTQRRRYTIEWRNRNPQMPDLDQRIHRHDLHEDGEQVPPQHTRRPAGHALIK